jgi:hypothetical protein
MSENKITDEQLKKAFIDSNIPAGHWTTWVAAVKWALEQVKDVK